MKTIIHKADSRGFANHGWLKSYHTFSFSSYHNPERLNFGALRVLNDDVIDGGTGFGRHRHENMEIVSIPVYGSLKHADSTGREEVITTGEVQIMSAGSGIYHSEYAGSSTESTNFLQIWILPEKLGIEPRYDQRVFPQEERVNKFQTVVSPNVEDGGLWINQKSWFSLADPLAESSLDYQLHFANQGLYVFVLEGEVEIGGQTLNRRDAIAISGIDKVSVSAKKDSKILAIEVPMQF